MYEIFFKTPRKYLFKILFQKDGFIRKFITKYQNENINFSIFAEISMSFHEEI